MKSLIYTVSLPLAALLGFAVHRASLCTVRTIAEIFSTRKAYMMAAMLKAVLWVMAVSVPILLFLPGTATPNRSYAITVAAISLSAAPLNSIISPFSKVLIKGMIFELK